jgi:hypothetical protein
MQAEKPRSWLRAVFVAVAVSALPGCDSAKGLVSLPNDDDAGLSDAATEAAAACFSQNVCQQHGDCVAATCVCAGRQITATERCVDHCCLSVYVACMRACADAGDGASDASDAGADATEDAAVDATEDAAVDATEDAAVDVSTDS